MPIKNYGVWVGYPRSFTAERNEDDSINPHITLYYEESRAETKPDPKKKSKFNAAINVKSTGEEARLVYWINRRFENQHVIESLKPLLPGFHPLPSAEKQGLDYIRGNLVDLREGRLVEHDLPGEQNDIIDYLSPIFNQAIEQQAKIFLFGEPYSKGGKGIHDIHMNQGNSEKRFIHSNGVYQDGGLIMAFPDGHWEAIFLAFASQKIHTDDETGYPIGNTDFVQLLSRKTNGTSTTPNENYGKVAITAALVNGFNLPGADGKSTVEKERVFLENRSDEDIDLNGWTLLNLQKQKQTISGILKYGRRIAVEIPDAPLSNKGGIITLLDKDGLKVHGVSYSADQAAREGGLVFFLPGPL
jgi:uncharacterized protein YukJ